MHHVINDRALLCVHGAKNYISGEFKSNLVSEVSLYTLSRKEIGVEQLY